MKPGSRSGWILLAIGLSATVGGGVYAAAIAPRNSVVSRSVRNGSLVAKDLKPNAGVTGKVVKDGSLSAADLAGGTGVVHSPRIRIDDPLTPGATKRTLLTSGPFTIKVECEDNGSYATPHVRLTSKVAGHASGLTPTNDDKLVPGVERTLTETSTDFSNDATNPRGVYALARNGAFLSLTVLEVGRPAAEAGIDCVFQASGLAG